jgi:hypothetical protein
MAQTRHGANNVSDKTKKVKKQKYKVKKDGSLKNKGFDFIQLGDAFAPRDTSFPVGESQAFTAEDLGAV